MGSDWSAIGVPVARNHHLLDGTLLPIGQPHLSHSDADAGELKACWTRHLGALAGALAADGTRFGWCHLAGAGIGVALGARLRL